MKILYSAGLAAALAACQPALHPESPSQGPPAAVSALPKPSLPPAITDYGPKDEVATLAQIRVTFKNPIIPIERLESSDERAKLASFHIAPALAGHFRFLTPKMVGFQADQALPKAIRVRVSVDGGLSDVNSHRLGNEFAWTFTSEPVRLTNLPEAQDDAGATAHPLGINPAFTISSNAELDPESLAKATAFVAEGDASRTAASAQLEKTATPGLSANAEQTFDPSLQRYTYTIKPSSQLKKATLYSLLIAPGITPLHGNLPSDQTFKGRFATYGALKFVGIEHASERNGRFSTGDPILKFSNGLEGASTKGAVKLNPGPKAGLKLVSVDNGDTSVAINPYALAPNTDYTVTIAPEIKDEFGQSLGKPQTAKFRTSDLAADFWSPTGLATFARTTNLRLNFSAVNLPGNHYRAAYKPLSPADIARLEYDAIDKTNAPLPASAAWARFAVPGVKNRISTIAVPVSQKLGATTGLLAYGAGASVNDNATFYGIVGITNIGIFAQWFPQSAWIAVQHLADGSPAARANVAVYRSETAAPCATGQTAADGSLQLGGIDIERCSAGNSSQGAPSLIVVAREGSDWSYTRLNDGSGSAYGLFSEWSNGQPISRGAIFSDRQMYQPGEHGALTGMAYYLQNGALKRDANASYAVSIEDANGHVASLGSKRTDRYGVFTVLWDVKSDQPLGYYTIKAVGANGNELYGNLRVAEFKPPNFNVALSLDKKFAAAGDTVAASGKSSYLFGAPLQNGRAHFYVTRSQANLAPKGLDAYQFGRQWFWPQQAPTVDSDVLQQDVTLNAEGRGAQNVRVAADLPFAMDYRVDMAVTDVSNLSVSDSQTFTALPSNQIIGLQNDFVANEGEAFPVKVIVTDPTGKPAEGRRVHLELQLMDYSAATQAIEGGQAALDSVKFTTVAQSDVTSGTSSQSIALTANKAGAYRIRANFADARSDATATDTQIWVSGTDQVRWNTDNKSQLKVTLDKPSYKPGDIATALIQSPYPQADLYFSVIRDKTLYKKFVKVRGGAPRVTFRVTQGMLPNAAVQALLVRRGKPLQAVRMGTLDSLVRIGFATFSASIDAKYLKLGIAPTSGKVVPGGSQTVRFALKSVDGKPAAGELAVMVVNDAILQLTGYRLPDLVKTVYSEQPISTRVSDNRPSVVLSPLTSPAGKGFGYGGGFMEGSGSTRVRRNFQQLAYYNGALRTDSRGNATVWFTMPDDLTTWRVLAIASGGTADDFRFAVNDATFLSTKPLISNPLLPQFGRTGDTVNGGIAITNTTGATGALSLDAVLSGALLFAPHNGQKLHQEQEMNVGMRAFRFPMTVGQGSQAAVQFTSRLGSAGDAFRLPFEIRNQAINETVAQSGAIVDGKPASIPVNARMGGTVDIWLAGSIVPEIVTPGERLLSRDALDFAENSASRLIVAATLKRIAALSGQRSTRDFESEAAADIAALRKLRGDDDGLRSWPGAKSDPLLSAYAAQSLAAARNAGFPVDATLTRGLAKYLASVLADPGKKDWCKSAACKATVRLSALLALSELGDTRTDFLPNILAQSDVLDVADRARLARYFLRFPQWAPTGRPMAQKLFESLYLTARNASVNTQTEWGWFGSGSTAQSELLRLAVTAHAPSDTLDAIVRTLTVDHCTCIFIDTYETARKLQALLDYLRAQPASPDFIATATLAGRTISARFKGPSAPVKRLRVSGSALGKTVTQLSMHKQGTGTLHYAMTYTYFLTGAQPGMLSGLRITRTVHPANEERILAQMGLQKLTAPVTLNAAQVYDIGLEIISDHPTDHVLITDPLPAGLEAVDATFQTSTPYFQSKDNSWQIEYQNIYKDRVFAYADRLQAGVYSLHYLVRSVTPGTYAWPGAEIHLQYAPEEFGRAAAATLMIPQ